jgi:hypothetical protein
MTVAELVVVLLRLPDQGAPVCLPPSADDDDDAGWMRDDQEVFGTSRWHRPHLTENGRALIDGPYVRLDAADR